MNGNTYDISIKIDGLDDIVEKVEKIYALMSEIKTLAKSITNSTITINLPDEN